MAIRAGFRARNRVRAIKLPSGVLCYMRNLRPTILGYIEVRFSSEILFFRYFGPKNHYLGAISGPKSCFSSSNVVKGGFYPITMLCNVVKPPTISIPWHNIEGLCDDMLWSFSTPIEVQPDFGPIPVSNTNIILSPKGQINFLSLTKKSKSKAYFHQ